MTVEEVRAHYSFLLTLYMGEAESFPDEPKRYTDCPDCLQQAVDALSPPRVLKIEPTGHGLA